ncbi:outer membrane protein assembly factor BamB family protein [Paenibacillus sp. HW567]|uniref:outer membrane protein assembly factor BamB family protein n=1 Tax=Paenibacillus sp. HW567 TaxID=1034769 RepID=UPI0009FE1605|nr:PQQ-binding-like beta-propeller repeat protein [Paenibacillus sp. HW567]
MTKPVAIATTLLLASLLTSGAAFPTEVIQASAATVSNSTTAVSSPYLTPLWQVNKDAQGLYSEGQQTSQGRTFYTTRNGLIAADITSGRTKWTYKDGTAPQIITNNSVFFITNQGELVKVAADSGKLLWKVKAAKAPIEIGAQAKLIDGVVYFANESGGMAAYNPATGKKIWANQTIPMYVGSLIGTYQNTLLVSSTVNNIRSQFFGLDPASGKQRWRVEGQYAYAGYRDGQLILRESKYAAGTASSTPSAPAYLMTLTSIDVKSGKITSRKQYQPLAGAADIYNIRTILQGSSVYSMDEYTEQGGPLLTRFTMGQQAEQSSKSYASYGGWLAGPVDGRVFFQKDQQITSVNLTDNTTILFKNPASPVIHLQKIGKAVYAGFGNGKFSIMNADTGTLLGTMQTDAGEYGSISVVNGIVLIPTEHKLFAVSLPKELR